MLYRDCRLLLTHIRTYIHVKANIHTDKNYYQYSWKLSVQMCLLLELTPQRPKTLIVITHSIPESFLSKFVFYFKMFICFCESKNIIDVANMLNINELFIIIYDQFMFIITVYHIWYSWRSLMYHIIIIYKHYLMTSSSIWHHWRSYIWASVASVVYLIGE